MQDLERNPLGSRSINKSKVEIKILENVGPIPNPYTQVVGKVEYFACM